MFHFVISFIFKNLCTMFYKKGCVYRFLDKKGELIQSCAILSRCCSVVFLPVLDKQRKVLDFIHFRKFEPFISLSITDQTKCRLDAACTVGILVFSQSHRARIAIAAAGGRLRKSSRVAAHAAVSRLVLFPPVGRTNYAVK